MHKVFYASGFLFHPRSQQILLQQSESGEKLSLFSGSGNAGETPEQAFQRVISEKLGLELKPQNIHPIYNYDHSESNKNYFVFYAEVRSQIDEQVLDDGTSAMWFNFKKLYKSKLTKDLLQDLVVGQRVINASLRINL